MEEGEPDATGMRPAGEDVIVDFSVWESAEALERLAVLCVRGPSPAAFTFNSAYASGEAERAGEAAGAEPAAP
ncbi:hypothetical protein [Actinomadura formosensis]|uniref:hypothetical protein n=1 Tax=Actinomadura formosensis TaxID=60706 RepID=UPI00083687D4|nr:hypothetical protein [Actinomadura formosensis]